MSKAYTQTSLVLAAKSAESKFDKRDIESAIEVLTYSYPEIHGPYILAFYGEDDSVVARATIHRCTCAKYRESLSVVCAHRLACMLFARARGIDREMEAAYPKVIEQMVGLMSDPFAIEHNAEIKFTVRANPNAGDGPFVLSMVAYSEDRDAERAIDRIGVYGSDLAEMCQEAFNSYQAVVAKYTRPTITEAENQGYGQSQEVAPGSWRGISGLTRENLVEEMARKSFDPSPNPVCPLCHGSGVVSDQVDYGSTVVSMPSACECVIDDNWDDLSREQKLLAWKDYLETVPRGDETYGRDPLDSPYGISHGVTCANCGESFGAHYHFTCPVPNSGQFEIDRVPVLDKEDLHETD